MRSRKRTLVAAAFLAAALGGCDKAWQVYDQVALGQPVPKDSPLWWPDNQATQPQSRPATPEGPGGIWVDTGFWLVPASIGTNGACVRLDKERRVTAKQYLAVTMTGYVLARSVAVRQVAEVQIPPDVLTGPADQTDEGGGPGKPPRVTLRGRLIDAMTFMGAPRDPLAFVTGLFSLIMTNVSTGLSFGTGKCDLEYPLRHLPLEGIHRDGYDRTFDPGPWGKIRSNTSPVCNICDR
jgi:hypothetical protein